MAIMYTKCKAAPTRYSGKKGCNALTVRLLWRLPTERRAEIAKAPPLAHFVAAAPKEMWGGRQQ